jgi:hypothetical protein
MKPKQHLKKALIVGFFVATFIPNFFMPAWIDSHTPRLPSSFVPHWLVSQLTGQGAMNDSALFDVKGTDLGIIVKYHGQYHYIFGDTFGGDYLPHQSTEDPHWRSNVMAYSTDTSPANGITIDGWIMNSTTGFARELFGPTEKVDRVDLTMIPTGAFVDGDKFYIFYMDINHWGEAGVYYCNNASIAYSTDGVHFSRIANMSWPGVSNFVMFGHVQDPRPESVASDMEYFMATPAGRYGAAYTVRVPRSQVLNQSAYQYLASVAENGEPSWSFDMGHARPVIGSPVGELSVMWNEYLQRFVMMTIEHYTATIVLRTAEHPWGPWSAPTGVVPFSEFPGLYGSFMHPDLVEDSGRIVYFIMSWWPFYNTYVMAADLTSIS